MKKLDVKKGYEIEFINEDNRVETALVNYVGDKKFSVKVFRRNEAEKKWCEKELTWFLSGKKTNRFYNWGNALRVVNKWEA